MATITLSQIRLDSVACDARRISFRRLGAYARAFLADNSRKLLLTAAVMFISIFIFFIFNLYTNAIPQYTMALEMPGGAQFLSTQGDLAWHAECEMMCFLTAVFAAIAGSMMFNAVSSRGPRLTTIEIPASQLEKFIVWFVCYLPCFFITIWLSFYLADVLRVAWTKCFTDFGSFAHVIPIPGVFALDTLEKTAEGVLGNERIFSITLSFCFFLTTHALFSLGSVFYPRLAFLKTAATLFVVSNVLGLMSFLGVRTFFGGSDYMARPDLDSADLFTSMIAIAVTVVFATLLYWIAYRRYKESEVIYRW